MKRKLDDKKYLNLLLQSLNVEDLKKTCKEFSIKGFSKLKKSELIDFILDSLSEEEISKLIEDKEIEILSAAINLAIKKINGDDRERLDSVNVVNQEKHEVEFKFKGFNWEVGSYLSITPKNIDDPDRDCDCRVGANMGLCNHFWVGFIFSLKKGWFNLADWTLTKLPEDFEQEIASIKLEEKAGTDTEVSLVDESAEDYELMSFENQSVMIYEAEIEKIEEKQSEFQDNITIWYLAEVKNVKMGPRVQKKSDFKEDAVKQIEKVNLRLSDKIMKDMALKAGDKIGTSGKLDLDNFLRIYIVKNIRKVERI